MGAAEAITFARQLGDHRADISSPAPGGGRFKCLTRDDPVPLAAEIKRDYVNHAAFGRAQRNPGFDADRGGQDKAVVVIGVFADQVDPPRRARDGGRTGGEGALEPCQN